MARKKRRNNEPNPLISRLITQLIASCVVFTIILIISKAHPGFDNQIKEALNYNINLDAAIEGAKKYIPAFSHQEDEDFVSPTPSGFVIIEEVKDEEKEEENKNQNNDESGGEKNEESPAEVKEEVND
ncbi:MAG: hypothetical protein GX196_01070 [Clostridiaceae bacterium]|nr:hypothetical protein [Clostridiaceae bacterium]